MDEGPCTSETNQNPRKRKQPDADDLFSREGPLTSDPIENEYEDLSDEGDASDDDGQPPAATHLKKSEISQILEAQEPASVNKIDGIKITPFNLKEELQEGEFDKAGNFVFKKQQSSGSDDGEENDNWAESIDWAEVERVEAERVAAGKINDEPKAQEVETDRKELEVTRDKISCYKAMLRLMKPDEIVKKTIQRLGEGIPKRKPVNKNKRTQADTGAVDQSSIDEMRRKLDLMIELAHQRLQDGDLDIYQKSYEDLEEAINC